MEDGEVAGGFGKASWASADADRHEHTIKIGMILCKIIRHHEDSQRVRSEVLHLFIHGERALITKDLVKLETVAKPKRNRKGTHCGKMCQFELG